MSEYKGAYLKSIVDDLQERVHALRSFDKRDEVNAYCDDLASQVLVTVESMITAVNKLQDELLAEINSYRQALVETPPSAVRKRSKDPETIRLEQNLARLSQEVDEFEHAVDGEASIMGQAAFQATKRKAEELKHWAKRMRREMRQQAFDGGFMKLVDGSFLAPKDGVFPRLDKFGQDIEDDLVIKHYDLNQNAARATVFEPFKIVYSAWNSDHFITSLLLLADGKLAVGVDGPLFVMDLKTRRILYKLEKVKLAEGFYPLDGRGLAQLRNGNLVAASTEGDIIMWDVVTKKHIKVIKLRRADFHSIVRRPSDDLLICDCKSDVLFVDPAQKPGKNVVLSIPITSYRSPTLQILSDGRLVVLESNKKYMIWDLDERKRVKRGNIPDGYDFGNRRILPNGEVAFYTDAGQVRMFDLLNDRPTRTFTHQLGPVIDVVLQRDNSILFVHLDKDSLQIPTWSSNGFYRPSENGFFDDPISYSPDGKFLVYGNDQVIVWPLND